MNDLYLIRPNFKISEAMQRLGDTQGIGLLVVDELKNILGSITDGDIRRALLRGFSINDFVEVAMCKTPLILRHNDAKNAVLKKAKESYINLIPVLNSNGTVSDLIFLNSHINPCEVPVVIMAGGLGARLGDLTKDCPKPMLKIGDKPVLKIILERLKAQGFKKFYISVNYKAEVIEEYFKDGHDFGCEILYLKEDKRLGTAGALSMLSSNLTGPIIVMNGDLLTKVDFRNLKEFHYTHESPLTICVRKYDFQVPYGVIRISNDAVKSLDEKPIQSFFVNAGVYVINSELLTSIPKDEFYDMTTFVNNLMEQDVKIHCFPIIEKWIDIGQIDDLTQARFEYEDNI